SAYCWRAAAVSARALASAAFVWTRATSCVNPWPMSSAVSARSFSVACASAVEIVSARAGAPWREHATESVDVAIRMPAASMGRWRIGSGYRHDARLRRRGGAFERAPEAHDRFGDVALGDVAVAEADAVAAAEVVEEGGAGD